MTVLGLINFIVNTKVKGISHYSKICRNPFKVLLFENIEIFVVSFFSGFTSKLSPSTSQFSPFEVF